MISVIIKTISEYYNSSKKDYQMQQDGVGDIQKQLPGIGCLVKKEGEEQRNRLSAEGLCRGSQRLSPVYDSLGGFRCSIYSALWFITVRG